MRVQNKLKKLVFEFGCINDYFGELLNKNGNPVIDQGDYAMLYNKYFDKLSAMSFEILEILGYSLDDSGEGCIYKVVDNRTGKVEEIKCRSLPYYFDGKWVEYIPSDNIGMVWVCNYYVIKPKFTYYEN